MTGFDGNGYRAAEVVTIEADPVKVARQARWWYGQDESEEPGHFVRALLAAIAYADEENTERLRVAFPRYVEAMETAERGDSTPQPSGSPSGGES